MDSLPIMFGLEKYQRLAELPSKLSGGLSAFALGS